MAHSNARLPSMALADSILGTSPPVPSNTLSAGGAGSDNTTARPPSLKRKLAATAGPTLDGVLGEELPRSVQDLLSGYFKARNTTVVPSEIYCIQAHRVYSTIDKRRAVYRCFLTGQQVEVRAYSLPSMRHKNSEKLLVAAGRMFPQPIVLARIKPHSNDFRNWLGAADNGTGAPVIQRFIPEHLQGGKQATEER